MRFESKDIFQKHVRSVVVVKDVGAVPMRFSAQSRARGIPPWDGPDCQYTIYTQLFMADGSEFTYTYLDFNPGTHGWERVECFVRPRLPIWKIQVNYFFEHKRGTVEYRDFRIEEAGPRPKPDRRVVVLGDSNCITSYLAPADRVDAMLAARLAKAYPSLRVDVENAGHNGDTVKRFLDAKRYERDLLTLDRIDVLFVRFGLNDRGAYGVDVFAKCHRELIRRLRRDFPKAKVILETGTYVDYPKHSDRDWNRDMKPYWDALRSLGCEADGVLDIWDVMRRETRKGDWDLRYRQTPMGKLIVNRRFDRGHEDDPKWFSNIHHTPAANRVIARAECDHITGNRLV
jgi:acyl-CoA thioesterase-1